VGHPRCQWHGCIDSTLGVDTCGEQYTVPATRGRRRVVRHTLFLVNLFFILAVNVSFGVSQCSPCSPHLLRETCTARSSQTSSDNQLQSNRASRGHDNGRSAQGSRISTDTRMWTDSHSTQEDAPHSHRDVQTKRVRHIGRRTSADSLTARH